MASMVIGRLLYEYQNLMENRSDPRVKNYFLMSTPWPTVSLSIMYILLCKWIGPKFMKNRPPYDLRKAIIVYNGLQVIFSVWMFIEFGQSGWFHSYSFTCQPIDYSNDPMAIRMLNVSWIYFLSKFTEFIDTFFFVLRCKMNHVSYLHVIHHGIMPVSVWLGMKFTPGGHSSFMGICNVFVHTLMYFYYMVAAMGPKYSRLIWWKKYLTNIQIAQFIIVSIHTFQLFFWECDYPMVFVWLIGLHSLLFLGLFLNFHIQTYRKPGKGHKPSTGEVNQVSHGKMGNNFKNQINFNVQSQTLKSRIR